MGHQHEHDILNVILDEEVDRLRRDDDFVHPDHYRRPGGIEPIEFIMANKLPFAEGCIVKYVFRHRSKGGLNDLKKAAEYLRRLMDEYEAGD